MAREERPYRTKAGRVKSADATAHSPGSPPVWRRLEATSAVPPARARAATPTASPIRRPRPLPAASASSGTVDAELVLEGLGVAGSGVADGTLVSDAEAVGVATAATEKVVLSDTG